MCDIGAYNSCLSKCRYYYANFDEDNVNNDYSMHDDDSILLIGKQEKYVITKIR